MFNPSTEYDILPRSIAIKDFHDYQDEYVVRPPYQGSGSTIVFCTKTGAPLLPVTVVATLLLVVKRL